MGTRINVLIDHDLADFRDRESVLARLASTVPSALAVDDYWRVNDPLSRRELRAIRKLSQQGERDEPNRWRAEPVSPGDAHIHRYTGPGRGLFLTVMQQAANIHTGGRWRGFLTIESVRHVHLTAFRRIARALGARCLTLYGDSCEVNDLYWGGRAQWECVELMERMWGPPQRSVEMIEPKVAQEAERTVPRVWFLESVSMKDDWPFADPKNVATFTVRQIVRDGHPILHVAHDADDGAWQFLEWESPREEDVMIVGLEEMTRIDPSIRELADLPLGWGASRASAAEPWRRAPNPEDGD